MSVGSHRCLRGLGVLHPKPLEKILSVLCLGDEGAVLELLHLEPKEVVQLGKRVITTSSSPGVALMQEGISYMAKVDPFGYQIPKQGVATKYLRIRFTATK